MQNGMSDSQLAHCTQDKPYCVSLQIGWIYNGSTISSKSDRPCMIVQWVILWFATADISCLIQIHRIFFNGRVSGNVCLKIFPGFYMKPTLIAN